LQAKARVGGSKRGSLAACRKNCHNIAGILKKSIPGFFVSV